MPLYGRAFVNTTGPGHNYTGGGTGMAEEGIWHYKVLPLAGAEVIELPKIGASYSYDPKRMAFVTYDTLNVTKIKAEYIKEKKLGGAMWWEVNMDKAGACSLTATAVSGLGSIDALERSENQLEFPGSKYANLRNGWGWYSSIEDEQCV